MGRYAGFSRTANGWPITPEALYWGPKFLYERYKKLSIMGHMYFVPRTHMDKVNVFEDFTTLLVGSTGRTPH